MWSRGTHCRSTWRPLGGRIMEVEQWEAGEVTAVWCPEVEVQRWWRSTWCGRHDKLKNDCVTKLMTRVRGGRKRTNNGDKQQRMMWRDNQEEMKVIDVQRKQRGRGTARASGSGVFFLLFFLNLAASQSQYFWRVIVAPPGPRASDQLWYKSTTRSYCNVTWTEVMHQNGVCHTSDRDETVVLFFSVSVMKCCCVRFLIHY